MTITGSIGIFGLVPNFSGLVQDKLGIAFDGVTTNKYSDYETNLVLGKDNTAEMNFLQTSINRGYQNFLDIVSEGRGMKPAEVDSVGQGRVGLATDAVKIKLVDKLGSLDDAVKKAAELAKLKEYHTANGRPVYGGGGITPDIFVAEDTTNVTSYYKQASMSGQIIMFAYSYTDENRQKLSQIDGVNDMANYLKRQNIVDKFATYAEKNGLKRRNLMIQRSYKLLERFIISRIIYNMMKEEAWIEYLNSDDPAITETLRIMQEGKAFPPSAASTSRMAKKSW